MHIFASMSMVFFGVNQRTWGIVSLLCQDHFLSALSRSLWCTTLPRKENKSSEIEW